MKFIELILSICIVLIISCSKDNGYKKFTDKENGRTIDKLKFKNKTIFAEIYDSIGKPWSIKSLVNDTIIEQIYFGKNGRIISKVNLNLKNQLAGPSYYFYPSGYLRSQRWYRNDTLTNIGRDFYDSSGILQRYIYYDSLGEYYYNIFFSDTSLNSDIFYNEKNPRTYLMVSQEAPEPTRTKIMKRMESIGLDSLKQIH